ncbi:MAG: hypothetical protein JWN70_7177 [Planctomycetaceae bacterium]|nr:hypothetical protein [Planctomycetaceae bacterium]
MVDDIVGLLRLFEASASDRETHRWVLSLATDQALWPDAHRIFNLVRERTLSAIAEQNDVLEAQYMFEEICLKSLYNETDASDPFDSDSPYWIIKCAIDWARQIGLPVEDVITVVSTNG